MGNIAAHSADSGLPTASPRQAVGLDPATARGLLAVEPPLIDVSTAQEIAAQYFNVAGRAVKLTSERDCNFKLETLTGPMLLKVSNVAEKFSAIEAQTSAMLYIAQKDPNLPVPRLRHTIAGEMMVRVTASGGERLIARLLEYLPGEPLAGSVGSAGQRRSVGTLLARLDRALWDFRHVGADRRLLWDITHAADLWEFLPWISDLSRRAQVERLLEDFLSHAMPVLGRLRAQTLHNDFNPHNLLVEAQNPEVISGIIDFGDMVHGALINDLAVAAAYHVPASGHPLSQIAQIVSGYHTLNPLIEEEIDILFDLIGLRQAATVIITEWRASIYPSNRSYILRNAPSAWHGLERLATMTRIEARAVLRAACK